MVLLETESWYIAQAVKTMVLLVWPSTVERTGMPPGMAKFLRAVCYPISRKKT